MIRSVSCLALVFVLASSALADTRTLRWQEGPEWDLESGTAQGIGAAATGEGLALAAAGANLLVDPGFEGRADECRQIQDPYTPNAAPTQGWQHNGLAGESGAVRPSAAPHAGAGAWELADTMNPGEPALLQRIPFRREYRGKAFLFSVWARTREGDNAEAMIALKFSTKGHWRADVSRPVAAGPTWRRYTLAATLPADADELGVAIGPSSYEGKGALVVDDAFLGEATCTREGSYTSRVQDLGQRLLWRASCRATTPRGTRLHVEARCGDTPAPDASWSAWRGLFVGPINGKALRQPAIRATHKGERVETPFRGRYLQYRLRLATSRPNVTPVVERIEFDCGAQLGFIHGRVVHTRTESPIRGATVTMGGRTTTTNGRGEFLLGLTPGDLAGTVTAPHYLPSRGIRRTIGEGECLRLDWALRPDPRWGTFRGDARRQGSSALSGSLAGFGEAWRHPLGTVGGGQTLPADVDGDGKCEVVVARGGSLSARRLNGDLLWQTDGWEIGSILGVYDLLGSGEKQVIGLSAGWQPYANGAFTVVRGRDGKVLSRVDTWPDAGDIGHGDTKDHLHGSFSPLADGSCVCADLDGDGKLELLVHPNYHSTLMAFTFRDGLTRPRMLWKSAGRMKYDLYCQPILAADVDGDKRLEVVFHDVDLIRVFDGRTGVQKSAADMGCPQGIVGPMACADVEGDGTAEVVLLPNWKPVYTRNTVALAGWNGKALVRRWTRDFPDPVGTRGFSSGLQSPFADVDGDGKLEVVVQVGPDVLVLAGADGAERCRIPGAKLSEAADLDGDRIAEVIVTRDGNPIAWNGKGGFGPKALAYPAQWGWRDLGDGEPSRLQGGPVGGTVVIGWPDRVKGRIPGVPYRTSPVVGDLDGNGRPEVVVRTPGGLIQVLDATGDSPRRLPFPEIRCEAPDDLRGGGITLCDLEGDGCDELIFRQEGRLVVAEHDGKVRFRTEMGLLRFPAVGRFDGDSVRDVACYGDKRWIAFSGKDGKVIWDQPAPETNEAATCDLDGDGRDEIAGKMGPAFLLNGADGRTLWTAFRKEQCALGLGVFADLSGDERMEVAITGEYTNTAWLPDGQNHWWIGWSSGGAKEHFACVADVNGDGAADFGLPSNHGVFYCVDGRDARQLWTFKIPEKVSLSHPAAADLDGDGRVEFVFGTNTGKLIVLNGEDGSVAKMLDFRYPVGDPIVADVDADGLAEVLFVCDGTLICVDAEEGNGGNGSVRAVGRAVARDRGR